MFFLSEEQLAERERKRQERVRRLCEKLRNWCNIDNIVDASVDLFYLNCDEINTLCGRQIYARRSKKQNKESCSLD